MGLFDFRDVAKAVRGAAGQVRALRAEIEQLRRTRDEIENAPAARSDVKAEFARYVRTCGAAYSAALGRSAATVSTAGQWKKLADPNPTRDANFFGFEGRLNGTGGSSLDGLICAVAPAQVLAMIERAVDQAEWPGPEGLPRAEREVEVSKLDKRIAELMTTEKELVSEARRAGIVIEEA